MGKTEKDKGQKNRKRAIKGGKCGRKERERQKEGRGRENRGGSGRE